MESRIVGMLAETSVHPGTGQSTGFVDLPVARESATDYPVIMGTSLKGALKQAAREAGEFDDDRVDVVFGKPDDAGRLIVSDGRLVLLPVRSLDGHYRWLTCPHLLERLARGRRRAGHGSNSFEVPELEDGQTAGAEQGETLFLEERQFTVTHPLPHGAADLLQPLVAHDSTRNRIGRQTVVLNNDDFSWFAEYGLSVNARNKLEEETKTSENLWYEETLPPDSLCYTVLGDRSGADAEGLSAAHKLASGDNAYLQVGGNETVGQGWFALEWLDEGGQQ